MKKATVDKLTRNYTFLDKHEPKAMAQEDIAQVAPPFEVIEVLAGAEERGQLSTQEYRSIRDAIWKPREHRQRAQARPHRPFPAARAGARRRRADEAPLPASPKARGRAARVQEGAAGRWPTGPRPWPTTSQNWSTRRGGA